MSQFYLQKEDGILRLCKNGSTENIFVDFLSPKFLFRLKTLSKNQPLFKAVGMRKDLKILDATAGLGADAVSFVHLGASVTAVEENESIFMILKDGYERALQNEKLGRLFKNRFELMHNSSINYMATLDPSLRPDVIYLDPMYPETEKSAKPKKEMLLLREFLKPTENLENLLEVALKTAKERVVLKRPHGSEFLIKKPTHSFESKLLRLDMYKI